MNRQHLRTAAKYALGLSLLAYVVWKNWAPPGGNGIADMLQRQLQLLPLLEAAGILLGVVLLSFVRWYVLVRAQQLPFTLRNAIRLGSLGFALSTFLPGNIGGDVFKAYALARGQSRRTVAVATVLIDRAVGLWGLVWLVALLGTGFWLAGDPSLENRGLQTVVMMTGSIVAGTVVVWLLLGVLPQWRADRFAGRLSRLPKVGGVAAEFWRAVWMYRKQTRYVALALALSLVDHVGLVLTFYFAAHTFLTPSNEIPSLAEHFVLIPIGLTWQALFPSPGGVGGGEYGFGKLYAILGKPEAIGVLAALIYRVTTWGVGLIGFLVYLCLRPDGEEAQQGNPVVDGPEPAADAVPRDQVPASPAEG